MTNFMEDCSGTAYQELSDIAEVTIEYAETYIAIEKMMNKAYVRSCLQVLYESMGAVLIRGYVSYWPAHPLTRKTQNLNRKPQVTRSGFMSQGRGLHWDVQKKWTQSKKKS